MDLIDEEFTRKDWTITKAKSGQTNHETIASKELTPIKEEKEIPVEPSLTKSDPAVSVTKIGPIKFPKTPAFQGLCPRIVPNHVDVFLDTDERINRIVGSKKKSHRLAEADGEPEDDFAAMDIPDEFGEMIEMDLRAYPMFPNKLGPNFMRGDKIKVSAFENHF